MRYNPDGSLDTTFGVGGKVITDFFSSYDAALALIIQSDGKLVAAGQDGYSRFALARYCGENKDCPLNQPPMANAGLGQAVDERTLATLDGSGSSDPDGDPLTFSWTQIAGPTVTLSNPTAVRPTFTAPEVTADTVLTFQLIVRDGRVDSTPGTANITVRNIVNQAPHASAGPDQTVVGTSPSGASILLNGSGSSDPDGDSLTYTWTSPFGATSGVSPTVTVPFGTYTVTLTVSDGRLTATDTVNITVLDTTAPEAYNQWDAATQDLVLFGRDALSGVASVNLLSVVRTDEEKALRTYQVVDGAGNSLLVVEQVKREGRKIEGKIVSLQYNQGPVLTVAPNEEKFEWEFKEDKTTLKKLTQKMKVGAEGSRQEVKAIFESEKNQTTIKVKKPEPETTVVKSGLVLLRLATSNGSLTIEY